MRIPLISAAVLLAACASGANSGGSEPPELRGTPQITRVELPSGAPIEINWEHQHTYDETKLPVSVEKAWAAYPAVFGELGIEPGLVDPKQHVYGNAGIKMRNSMGRQRLSKYFDCGSTVGMPNADTYDVLVRVVSQVIPADAGLSALRTQVEATAHANAVSGATVRCVSTGALEERISHMLSEMVAKPGNS